MKLKIGFVSYFFIFASAVPLVSYAQQQAPPLDNPGFEQQGAPADQADPEDRNHGVARISLLNGDVSVRRGDSGDQVAAAINAPLVVQDAVITGPASRAELQFDTANRVRFGNETEVRLSQLTADHFQIQIARGTLTWAVLSDGNPVAEIATPSVAVRPLGRGDYRISVLPDGSTQITARSGNLEVYTPRGVERVPAGQTMLARGPVDNPEFQVTTAIARDEWDVFNERRNRELLQSQSYNYVSRDIAGAEDLDNYGQWNNDSAYGQVWTPRVAADWSPYRLGRWGYEDYYGWTWISSDPWGWAPYHYGSWFRGNYGWSWCPGSRYSHYYYRPALVAFFGYGGGGGFSFGGGGFGFGNIGWVPLAPFERYNRWYGRGFGSGYNGFGRNVNIVNNTNITNYYRNARVSNGVTGVNSRDFANGNFGRYSSPVGSQLQQAGMIRGQVPFTPNSNHLRFNDRQTAVQGRSNFSQTAFSNGSNFGRQNSTFTQGNQRQTTPAQGFGGFGRQSTTPGNSGSSSWGRFGSPAPQSQSNNPQSSNFGRQQGSFGSRPAQTQNYPQSNQQSSNGSSWQRFGSPAPQSQFNNQQNSSFGRQQGSFENRPAQTRNYPQNYQQGNNGSSWQRFGDPATNRPNSAYSGQNSGGFTNSRQSQPVQQYQRGGSQSVQVAPPVVRERSYTQQPRQPSYNRPAYSQPNYSSQGSGNRGFSQQSSPYNQPRSESRPSYQAPRQDSSRQSSSQGSHGGNSGNFHGGNSSGSHDNSNSHNRK